MRDDTTKAVPALVTPDGGLSALVQMAVRAAIEASRQAHPNAFLQSGPNLS